MVEYTYTDSMGVNIYVSTCGNKWRQDGYDLVCGSRRAWLNGDQIVPCRIRRFEDVPFATCLP